MNKIGNELVLLRETESRAKILTAWFQLTIDNIESDNRFSDVVYQFRNLNQKKLKLRIRKLQNI